MALSPPPKALLFDVFGTCVDWRSTVTNELYSQAHAALNSATASLASTVRVRATNMTLEEWGAFAQQWRNSYKKFTMLLATDPTIPWKSVDEHHLDALRQLLIDWQLGGLWNDEEQRALSLVWHRLTPWPDSAAGIAHLNRSFDTCTLSNGNISLLTDLRLCGSMPFTHVFSAELFGSYKPSPKVYLGAAEKLGIQPHECALIAAHLNDLRAAKDCGYRAIYVERPAEEDWSIQEVEKAREDGWVDIWIGQEKGSGGFVTLAERLGVDVKHIPILNDSAPV